MTVSPQRKSCGRILDPVHLRDYLIDGNEYVSDELGIKLVWTPDIGWRSAALDGEVIDDLTVQEVAAWLKEDDTFVEPVKDC